MANDAKDLQRSVLPIPERANGSVTTYDAKDPETKYPPIEPVRPPKGAPNVLVVLLDDVGFAASSPFGGVISTPTAERLAGDGLRYTRFHTTALCSPTRQALLTGRDPRQERVHPRGPLVGIQHSPHALGFHQRR